MTEQTRTPDEAVGEVVGCVGLVTILPFTTAFYAITNGYVVATLWGWFVAPTFHVASLGLAQAVGLALLLRWLSYHRTASESTSGALATLKSVPKELATSWSIAGFTLLTGYVVQRWFL